jgi:hypothetical protein
LARFLMERAFFMSRPVTTLGGGPSACPAVSGLIEWRVLMSVLSGKSKVMLRSPGAFAAALPALVGFHPSDSLVAVFLGEGQVIVSMRLDIPQRLEEVAEYVASTGTKVEADEVVLALYCPKGDDLPDREGVAALITVCHDVDINVRDAMLIDGGRLWSYMCRSIECCPPEGIEIPTETVLLEAERVGQGLPVAASSRDDVVQRYAPRLDLAPSQEVREQAMSILTVPLEERARQVWDEVRMLAGSPHLEDLAGDVMRARIQAAMGDVRVRDYVLASIALSQQDTDSLVDVVVQAALTAPEDLRPRMAGAAAALLCSCGESSIATTCLLELAGGESLADLVRTSVEAAVPPRTIREVFGSAMPLVERQLRAASKETPPATA